MRRLLMSFAVVVVTSFPAFATDYGNWSGFYAGANIGGAKNDSNWRYFSSDGSGVIGGIQGGYNYQISNIILGFESSIDGISIDGKSECTNASGPVADSRCFTKQDALSSIRGRAGIATANSLLVYATGGIAFTDYKYGEDEHTIQSWNSGWRTGGTIGGGLEYMLAQHWTTGIEYAYYDFGTKTEGGGINPVTVPFKEHENAVAFKVNYKF